MNSNQGLHIMKKKWINKLFIGMATLGLSSLTFAEPISHPNMKEIVEVKVETDANKYLTTPCVIKEVGNGSTEIKTPIIECHYVLNGSEYHYKFERYKKLSKQILKDINIVQTVQKQPESIYKLIIDNVSYFNLFYTIDDIEQSLDYIEQDKIHLIKDDFYQINDPKETISNMLNNKLQDADYFINNSATNYYDSGIMTYIQDQYKTARIVKPKNYNLDDLFNEIWNGLSDVDRQKNVKLIEKYFSKFAMEKDVKLQSISKAISGYNGTVPDDYDVFKNTIVIMSFPKTVLNNSMKNGSEYVENNKYQKLFYLLGFSLLAFVLALGMIGVFYIVSVFILCIILFLFELYKTYINNKKEKYVVLDAKAQPYQNSIQKPDISKVEELINQVELVKNSFKTIGYEYELDTEILDMMTRFNLLKEAVYSEMNRIDWANNNNIDIIQQYQTVIDSYIEVMDNEYSKIKEKFDNVMKKDVEDRIKNIQIIQDSK